MTNYDVATLDIRTAELLVTCSYGIQFNISERKTTNRDYDLYMIYNDKTFNINGYTIDLLNVDWTWMVNGNVYTTDLHV